MENILLELSTGLFALMVSIIVFKYHRKLDEQPGYNILNIIYSIFFTFITLDAVITVFEHLNVSGLPYILIVLLYKLILCVFAYLWFCLCQAITEKCLYKNTGIIIFSVLSIIISIIPADAYDGSSLIMCIIASFGAILSALYGMKGLSLRERKLRCNIMLMSLIIILSGSLQLITEGKAPGMLFGIILVLLIHNLYTMHGKITTDRLTGIKNRYGMDEELEEQLSRYRKDKTDSFYLITCDLDDFKSINDEHGGHEEGDRALTLVAGILTRVTEKNDAVAFRNGGDEFVIITDKSDEDVTKKICAELEAEFEALHFRDDFKIKMSIGYALFDGKADIGELMARADQFLYDEKQRRKKLED